MEKACSVAVGNLKRLTFSSATFVKNVQRKTCLARSAHLMLEQAKQDATYCVWHRPSRSLTKLLT